MRPAIERELQQLGIRARVIETRHGRDAGEIAARLALEGVPWVAAAGGDGTVHDVANGLLGSGAPQLPTLGVIPIGTGNDFVKLLGARGRAAAIARIAGRRVRRFDVGRAEWGGEVERFVNGMGTGVDVEVVRQLLRHPRLPGFAGYIVAAVRALAGFDPVRLRLESDGVLSEPEVLILAVGNGVCQGGGFYFWPDASPEDGRLDVCIVGGMSLARVAGLFPRIVRGTHAGRRGITQYRAARLAIAPAEPQAMHFQLDGELRCAPAGESVIVSVEHRALPVFADQAES